MATKAKRTTSAPRYPEKKWGPFHGGVGIAVWLNEVQTEAGPKFFRSVSLQSRRYRDKKTGVWKDAKSRMPFSASQMNGLLFEVPTTWPASLMPRAHVSEPKLGNSRKKYGGVSANPCPPSVITRKIRIASRVVV